MATFVNDLRLTELATGEGSGTWGSTTNQSLELIGEALGYATQEVFSSDADATTTIADGASDPARAMYFKITSAGSLTATRTCTIAPNTVSRVMFIENATTGSQSIAISQGSGANVTIATGKTAVVYLDGAGSGAAVVDAMAGVDPGVTDTLAEVLTAGNTTTTDQKIQFRDAAIYINSSADGQLDLVADTEIQIAATTIDVNGTLAFNSLKGTGATTVTNILDQDNMASDSATALATQQSIKAYVDSQVGSFDTLAEVLAQGNTTGGTDLAVSTGDDITFADSSKAIFGAGSDLQIYHSGTHSFIEDKGTGNLYIDGASSVVIRGETANTISAIFNDAGSVVLKHNGDTKLATTATGIDVTGNATFGDNAKAIFGAGSDLQIYHDGSHSYVSDQGTGSLRVLAENFQVRNPANNEAMIIAIPDSGVTLYHNNAAKLATTATGIDVTGTATMDGLTVDAVSSNFQSTGATSISLIDTDSLNDAFKFNIENGGRDGRIGVWQDFILSNTTGTLARFDNGGDISFYEDTGTTPKFFWDASAESLGIGGSPSKRLHVFGPDGAGEGTPTFNANTVAVFQNNGTSADGTILNIVSGSASTGFIAFGNSTDDIRQAIVANMSDDSLELRTGNNSTALTIDSAGNLDVTGNATFGDSGKAIFGAGSDLQIYHDGSGSYIDDQGTGPIRIRSGVGGALRFQDLDGDDLINATSNGAVTLYYNNAAKLATTATGIDVTGTVTADGLTVSNAGSNSFLKSEETTGAARLQLTNTGANVLFGTDNNSGGLTGVANQAYIYSANNLKIGVNTFTAQQLTINSTGIDVTGTVTADGLTVDVTDKIDFGGGAGEYASSPIAGVVGLTSRGSVALFTDSNNNGSLTGSAFTIYDGAEYGGATKTLFNITKGNDISFYEDTGTTPKFFWDASAESLGIGTSSPSGKLDVELGTTGIIAEFRGAGSDILQVNSESDLIALDVRNTSSGLDFQMQGASKMRLTQAGNVGIGTSSPEKPLHVNSGTGNIGVRVESSDATASIEFMDSGTTSTGLSPRIGGISDDFFVQTSGSERMRIDASGNVGIGTSSPDHALEITAANGSQFKISRDSAPDTQYMTIGAGGNSVTFDSYETSTHSTYIWKSSISGSTLERMRIDVSGNLLVGTSSAGIGDAGIELRADGQITGTRDGDYAALLNRLTSDGDIIDFRKDGTSVGSIGVVNGDRLYIATADGLGLQLDKDNNRITPSDAAGGYNSNVSLGGSSLLFKDLHLSGTANVAGVTSSGQIKVTASNATTVALSVGDTGTGFYNAGTNVLGVSTSGSEAARFDSGGGFYVGTTTTGSNVANGFTIQNPAGATYTTLGHANGTATGSAYTVFSYNSGTIGSITQSGTTAVLYNTTSDQRLKENIADAGDAGSKIDAIQVRKFDWKADDSHQDFGMVAQELLEVAPEAVHQPQDPEEMMGVDYSKLVPIMLKEIQSLRARIAALES